VAARGEVVALLAACATGTPAAQVEAAGPPTSRGSSRFLALAGSLRASSAPRARRASAQTSGPAAGSRAAGRWAALRVGGRSSARSRAAVREPRHQ
jgi:hypothetical protein